MLIVILIIIFIALAIFIFRKKKGGNASLILSCAKCKEKYDLGSNAQVITDESKYETLVNANAAINGKIARYPDLVMRAQSIKDSMKCDLNRVLSAFHSGEQRTWRCHKCNYVQQYPRL